MKKIRYMIGVDRGDRYYRMHNPIYKFNPNAKVIDINTTWMKEYKQCLCKACHWENGKQKPKNFSFRKYALICPCESCEMRR